MKPVAQAAENPPNSRGLPDSRSQNSQIRKAVYWKMAVTDFVSSSFESGSMEDMGKKSKHEKGAGSTPATVQLEKAGVPFKTYEYEHSNDHMDDGYGVEAAKKLGFDEHQVFKTLMADTGSERVVGVVPVSGHMDLKALAAAVGAKKASMADRRSRCASPAMWSEASHRSGSARITRPCLTRALCNSTRSCCPAASAGFRSASIRMICSRC